MPAYYECPGYVRLVGSLSSRRMVSVSLDPKLSNLTKQTEKFSFKKVADEIGVSEATVFVRVKKLQEHHVINGFTAIIDPKAVGKSVTAITLVRAMPRSFLGILDELRKIDDIYEIYDVTGQYSSILKIRASSTDELGQVIDRIGMVEGVAGTETIIVLRTVKEDPGVKI